MKHIYLNTEIAKDAIRSKDRLEALSFAILVKDKFTSSMVNNATIRSCKELFKIGSTRTSRIIKNGLEYGYLRREKGALIANKIKAKGYNVKIELDGNNLNSVMDIVRKSVLLNHIKVQNRITDTFQSASNPKFLKEYKSARKRVVRGMTGLTDYGHYGTSTARVMEVTNTKRTKARAIVGSLVLSGKLIVKHRAQKTMINPDDFYNGFAEHQKSLGCPGYLFLYKGEIWQKVSNKYIYNCFDICKL
ncbi:hypothetical protein [Petrimonas sulfuriphila]|uniref:hypothetical protein n=1 Tax=Petrimonas sulfuriphila TaxID=285070 RepID=UPI003EBFD54E